MPTFNLKPLVKRFAIAYIVAIILVMVVFFILEKLFGVSANSASGLISIMVAAMDMGQNFYKQENRVPEKSESWRMARAATGVTLLISALLFVAIFIASPGSFANVGLPGLIVVLVIMMLITLLAIRFFASFGAKNYAKALARQKS
ncbi:hypothetical protein BFP76_06945 [Amylibacter kogurei]|uniref:Uncharacterized protein n=1 Tax=Paramylibacter kogurei TaxID=1889778 RepID=A0A2G5K7Q0_9RHOB|nr:ABZJ_00895 family protein [Amylibacter kogurei]PIB24890.1 hypothetical protein BFP76_06945 [Amylibacter kogurei]